jgi:hypothetical protein
LEVATGIHLLQQSESDKSTELFSAHSSLQMSIRLRQDGISFLMASTSERKILYFKNYFVENSPLKFKLLEKILVTEQPTLLYADSIKWSYYSEKFTIIPEELYNPALKEQYFEHTVETGDDELIGDVYSGVVKAHFLFAIHLELHQLIIRYSPTRFKLSNVLIADKIMRIQEVSGQGVYIDLTKNGFFILIGNKGKLQLYNYFPAETPEDLIYHVLFSMEQFYLNAEKVPVYISGCITEGDENHSILKKFIKNCNFSGLLKGVELHPLAGDKSIHHFFYTQVLDLF